MAEVAVSPLQENCTNNGLKRRLETDILMDEASPSPAPAVNSWDKVKKIRMNSAGFDASGFSLGEANRFGRENCTNNAYREFGLSEDGPVMKRVREDAGMKLNHIGQGNHICSSSSSSMSALNKKEDLFGDTNSLKLRESFYSHMERQTKATQEKLKKMEPELQAQKSLNQRLLGKLQEKEDERRVLVKGVTISDNRNRELQMQVQDLQAECKRSRYELSTAQKENSQLQVILQGAREYILHLERQIQGHESVKIPPSGGNGCGGHDHFMPPPPPDVF